MDFLLLLSRRVYGVQSNCLHGPMLDIYSEEGIDLQFAFFCTAFKHSVLLIDSSVHFDVGCVLFSYSITRQCSI